MKILFISHDAHRNGAPIVFLHFLRWFQEHGGLPFEILLKNGGELEPEFSALAPTQVWTRDRPVYDDISLIYSNTVTNGELLEELAYTNASVICHVHELEYWITYKTSARNNACIRQYTTRYVAASRAVQRALQTTLDVPMNLVDVVYECVPVATAPANPAHCAELRAHLGIPSDSPIVGGSGTTDWRKGPDIFVQVARALSIYNPSAHFLWVGGDAKGAQYGALRHDADKAGLGDRVHFTGHTDRPHDYYALFDVFAMTSREDPFPLVNLETAAMGIPIVCFDQSGGSAEFVGDECGYTVPYLDVVGMAERIRDLLDDDELRREKGAAARRRSAGFDVRIAGPRLLEIIRATLTTVGKGARA
ncbi:MAG: glycosyltransferase [Spartobacteria bacterium]|nr:glycosyltransferase [Spartobacteria bacterium]